MTSIDSWPIWIAGPLAELAILILINGPLMRPVPDYLSFISTAATIAQVNAMNAIAILQSRRRFR
jgi:hypothetical protein